MRHLEDELNKFRFYREWSADPRTSKLNWAMLVAFSLFTLAALQTNINVMIAESIESEVQLARVTAPRGVEKKVELNQLAPQESDRIIVKYKERDLPRGLQIAAERANLENAQGLTQLLTIDGIGAVVYQVGEDDTASEVVDRIRAEKRDVVEYAEVDMLVPPELILNDPNIGSAWHIPKVQAPTAWDTAQGSGITIAIGDTGVDCTHPDLAGSCVPGWNVVSGNADTTDIHGHGTKVAGTAAAIGNNSVGAAGIAYAAKIMPIRITNSADGYAYFSDAARAITWAADNKARVVSVSYGICGSASAISAAQYMRSKGGVVTVSAMNTGADPGYAASPELTCVSATNSGDSRTSWSSYGAYVDVAAPGEGIYTTTNGGGYGGVSGTSFSAPLTAGIYGLIFSTNPALSPSEADSVLFGSVDDLGNAGWDMYYGHGRVNAAKAVVLASTTKGTMGVPDTTAPSVPQNLSVTGVTGNSATLAWGQSTDNVGVTGYAIYRNGTKLTTVTGTTYTNTGLAPVTAYTYAVTAIDKASNESAKSNEVTTTTGSVDLAITAFSVLTKTATDATVSAVLTKPGTVTVNYGTSASSLSMSASSATTSTAHTVSLSGLTAVTTYYYQVVATDATGATVSSPVSSFKTTKAAGGGKPRR